MKAKQGGVLAGVALVLAVLLPLPVAGRIAGLPSICASWNLLGVPCPFCGMTRSVVCCGHCQFTQALAYHPLGPAAFVLLIVAAVASLVGWRPKFSQRVNRLTGAAGITVCGTVWLMRLAGHWPLP